MEICVFLPSLIHTKDHMARQQRAKSGTGIYHIMLRGINRQDIFEEEEDYLQMTSILRRLVERYDEKGIRLAPLCVFYAYCLMSNHVHLLIQEQEENISDTIKKVGVSYARYFNQKYERGGHLFQDRFRSEPVNTIEYFVTLLRYIHQNPVKAKIVESVKDYRWSSWHEYLEAQPAESLCNVNYVFSRIPREDLIELVSTPVEECDGILDIDTCANVSVSDSDIKLFLLERHGIANPLMVQSLERVRRNEILRSARTMGAGIRQLSRLTGISFGVIQKL